MTDSARPAVPGEPQAAEQLQAYLASALTGLAAEAREQIFEISDVVAASCREHGIDLYEPRKITDPVHHPDVPDTEVFRLDRQRVVRSDLLVYLADQPSTGAGQELVFATEAMLPIIVVARSGLKVSRMVTGMPGSVQMVRYQGPDGLGKDLNSVLAELRPALLRRRSVLREYRAPGLGPRIRELRESRRMSYEDLVRAVRIPGFLSADQIRRWEEGGDLDNNLSILVLRELAAALGVGAADLLP
ncbi:XRE family transcriptional regulator [Streptacidiphilus sp. N1-12]|uniref:XRE family transcriptional regulator n=2 Tax=Streptacidiphilus alkalitolerans TaxID=3342712 RepID=A0ABV6WKB3_9ACTN